MNGSKQLYPMAKGRYSILPALAWPHLARVMIKIEIVRERYHYGTKDARLYRDIAVGEADVARAPAGRSSLCVFL